MTRCRRCGVTGSRAAESVTAGSAAAVATWVVVERDVAAEVLLLVVAAAVAVRSVVALPEAAEAALRELPVVAPAVLVVPADLAALAVDLRWAAA